MATTTETQTAQSQTKAPEITILTRFVSIPVISSSLVAVNDALSSNAYTRFSYNHAKGLSLTVINMTEPIQVKLAPIIVRADSLANKAVDVVEARYPYPFKARPEEVKTLYEEKVASTTSFVQERYSDVVTTPARIVHGIDQRFTPIVDYFEHAVCKFNNSPTAPSTPDGEYQYQRALALSKALGENLYVFTSEQLTHLQHQYSIVQKASETANSISDLASSTQNRVSELSNKMIAELQKLQASTSSLTVSLQNTLHNSAAQFQTIPPQLQQAYADVTASLSSSANELVDIVKKKDLPPQEKIRRVTKEVQERVQPLLEAIRKGLSEVLPRSSQGPSRTPENTNGNASQ